MLTWTSSASAVSVAFLGSLVEAIEALAIVLAVATVRSWRPAGLGVIAGLGSLTLVVLLLGPLLAHVPLSALRRVVGVMLSAFGVFWTGEGLGMPWPGQNFAILAFAVSFLIAAAAAVTFARRAAAQASR